MLKEFSATSPVNIRRTGKSQRDQPQQIFGLAAKKERYDGKQKLNCQAKKGRNKAAISTVDDC
jgi:hypothetical protein